jgi:hypothetical protein
MESTVKFIRLVTGEDLVADVTEVESSEEAYYIVNNPMKIVYLSSSKPGVLSISLMQWVFTRICDEQSFTIYPEDILTAKKASDSMEDYYWTSVEHFTRNKDKFHKQTEFDDNEDNDQSDLIDSIIDLLKNTDKGKLH